MIMIMEHGNLGVDMFNFVMITLHRRWKHVVHDHSRLKKEEVGDPVYGHG